eukprot:gene18438-20287_t
MEIRGVDNLNTELIKYGPNILCEGIAKIVNIIAETGEYPEDIKEGILIPLSKPGKKPGPLVIFASLYSYQYYAKYWPSLAEAVEVCATANSWDATKKPKVLPAFLRGPAAAHFHAFEDDQKDSYAHLAQSLREVLCPAIDREKFFAAFDQRIMRPNEDPSLFLYDLKDALSKADPTLQEDARHALLSRQFLKGSPPHQDHATLHASLADLAAAVSALALDQKDLRTSLATPPPLPQPSLSDDFPVADTSLGGCVEEMTDSVSCLFIQSSVRGPVPVHNSVSVCIPGRSEVLVTGKLPKAAEISKVGQKL